MELPSETLSTEGFLRWFIFWTRHIFVQTHSIWQMNLTRVFLSRQ